MNGIVALGGRALAHVAASYRAHNPAAVWVLGAETSPDIALYSLEALLEPFMNSYFTGEAVLRMNASMGALRERPDICGQLEPGEVMAATEAVLKESLIACLSFVEMLDRADKLHPIELVVVSEPDAPLPATAVAWARARGIPSVFFDPATMHGTGRPATDRVVAFGGRAREAYNASGVDAPQLAVLPHPKNSLVRTIAANRSAYRARVQQVQGWSPTDCLVAFEPDGTFERAAGDAMPTYEASLHEIFAAYATARETVPTLRLAVLPATPVPGGMQLATTIAVSHGVSAKDFVYAETDADIWFGIADIIVSNESFRTLEGAVAGVATVNVWRPANWYAGPAFGAQDGIIDALPSALGATLAALAANRAVCREIAAIAGDRVGPFGMQPADALSADTAVRAAEALLTYRAPRAPIRTEKKLDIVVYAPAYTHASAGIRALHRLCHFINMLGGNASMYPGMRVHPTWNNPRRIKNLTEESIVVYPETAFTPLPARRVVRWVLNVPGLLDGATRYDDAEMVFYHTGFRDAAQSATAELLDADRELSVCTIEPELYYHDLSRQRLYDCVYIGKGEELYARCRPPETAHAFVIRRHENAWPANRSETAAMLRSCRKLYLYDPHSAIFEEAALCGVTVIMVGEDGALTEYCGGHKAYLERDLDPARYDRFLNISRGYKDKYYDQSQVERFLQLLAERWS